MLVCMQIYEDFGCVTVVLVAMSHTFGGRGRRGFFPPAHILEVNLQIKVVPMM